MSDIVDASERITEAASGEAPKGNVVNSAERSLEPVSDLSREPATPGPQGVVPSRSRSPALVLEHQRQMGLELRQLWAHRDLLFMLAWRDVKVRYKQTVLGAAWAILQPLLGMVIFTLLFGRLAHLPSDGEPYAIFSYAGLLPWNFFSTAVTNGANSLVTNTNLITKVYFPRLLVPLAALGAALVDMSIASLLLLMMMPIYGVGFHLTLLLFVPLMLLTALTAAAFGIWTSALNVKYRDIRYALPFVLQMMMFLTPVIYPVNFLPERWRWVLRLNPLSGILEGFRDAIFGHPFNWSGLALSAGIVTALLLVAGYIFQRMEDEFADII